MAVFEKACDFRFDKNTTCCFSGHRPEKLPGNGDVVNSMALRRILSVLRLSIEEAIKDGYKTFVSGMAPVWICGRRHLSVTFTQKILK